MNEVVAVRSVNARKKFPRHCPHANFPPTFRSTSWNYHKFERMVRNIDSYNYNFGEIIVKNLRFVATKIILFRSQRLEQFGPRFESSG